MLILKFRTKEITYIKEAIFRQVLEEVHSLYDENAKDV